MITDAPDPTAGQPETTGPLVEQFDGLLLDLDGVVYIGSQAVPEAVRVLSGIADRTAVRFVTNNASRPSQEVAAALSALGVRCSADQVITSGELAAAWLAANLPAGEAVLVVGGPGLVEAVAAVGLRVVGSAADRPAAVVQGFGPAVGWAELAQASVAVAAGVRWVATNLDLTLPTPFGQALGNGALVAAVSAATGRRPDVVTGKPEAAAFTVPALRWGMRSPLVVGDRLDTDIAGARAAGYPSLLVMSGITGVADLFWAPPHHRPRYLGRDLRTLEVPYPQVSITQGPGGLVDFGVGSARVSIGQDQVDWGAAADAVDLLRAGAAAAWWAHDHQISIDRSDWVDRLTATWQGAH